MHDRLIGEVRKSARESIRVILREKRGDVGLDLRIAVTNSRGGLTETAKGIRIPLAQVGDIISALQEAQRLAGPPGP